MRRWIWTSIVLVMAGIVYVASHPARLRGPGDAGAPASTGGTSQPASETNQAPHQAAMEPPHQATMETLVEDLGSGDVKVREAARGLLASVHYRRRGWLRGLADAAEGEVKTAIEARLGAIEEQLATEPPPISLHVKEATLGDVVFALNEEMGTEVKYRGAGNRAGTYTLDVTDQPFWEVIAALNAQRPFYMSGFHGEEMYVEDSPMGMMKHAISGPFFCYASADTIGATTPPSFMLHFNFLADPRMHIADLHFNISPGNSPDFATIGPDSAGNVFKFMSRGGYYDGHGASCGYNGNLQLVWPASPGESISFLKATVGFVMAVPGLSEEVDPVVEGWKSTKLGDVTATLSKLQVEGTRGQIECRVVPAEKAGLLTFLLFDGNDGLRWAYTPAEGELESGVVGARLTGLFKPPQKLRVLRANRMHARSASFEIRDIPIPKR
jgi:hypothetical protein